MAPASLPTLQAARPPASTSTLNSFIAGAFVAFFHRGSMKVRCPLPRQCLFPPLAELLLDRDARFQPSDQTTLAFIKSVVWLMFGIAIIEDTEGFRCRRSPL